MIQAPSYSFPNLSFSTGRGASNYSEPVLAVRSPLPSPATNLVPNRSRPFMKSSALDTMGHFELDQFIQTTVQPDQSFLQSCSKDVDILVKYLQNNVPPSLRPSEVIKGGSLGKGTAVKGNSDIDLTVMLAEYTNVRTLKNEMPSILQTLEQYLREIPDVKVIGKTSHAVQLVLPQKAGYEHSVDVLPAVDVTNIYEKSVVYNKMLKDDRNIKYFYSACLTPLQMKMYATLPTKLKSLIRLVKFWKKNTFAHNPCCPTSYPFEIIILDAWNKAGSPEQFDTCRGFHAVLQSLVNHREFGIFLKQSSYEESIAQKGGSTFIMDPCNPTNDIYNSRGWDWEAVANAANALLQAPLFSGVSGTKYHWLTKGKVLR